MLEEFVIWGMIAGTGKRALWGCGSCLQIFEGLSWGKKIRLVLKGLQGVEIKMTDGDDRQSDVSPMNERLPPGRTRKMGRWALPVTRVSKNRQVTLASGLRKKPKDWWVKDSVLLEASDGSENPMLWSIYTLGDQTRLEMTMHLVTQASWLYSVHLDNFSSVQFSSFQSLSRVRLFATPWTAAHQASQSITNAWSSLKLMSIESVMPSNHLILCRPLLLSPSVFPSIRVFFKWVSSSHQVVKVLEFQLQHHSFQRIFRTDFL